MKQFVRNLLFGDWLLKLFSLMLALLTWFAVSDSLRKKAVEVYGKPDVSERPFFDVPVQPMSGNSDVHEFKLKPSEVNVTLQGEKDVLQKVESRMIRIHIDLTDATVTNRTRWRVDVVPPTGTTTVRVDPEEVEVIPPPSNPQSDK